MRADQHLVERGLVASRARAQAEIRAGHVLCNGQPILRPSAPIHKGAQVELLASANRYVSRGALKLVHALEHFGIDAAGTNALDIGASTGGFTEVLLKQRATRIYAVDVGQDQLHRSLRNSARVCNLEKTNARDLDVTLIPEPLNLIVCDASFISLKLVLPAAMTLAAPGACLVALIKPQFEVGKGNTKKGIVRDAADHEKVCTDISEWIEAQTGWHVRGLTQSPIQGPDGNIEFLVVADYAG